jgi:hypothetical protein
VGGWWYVRAVGKAYDAEPERMDAWVNGRRLRWAKGIEHTPEENVSGKIQGVE